MARATTSAADRGRKTNVGLFQSAMPADGTLAARSHARISASLASRAATQNLADFTGKLYPPIGGPVRSMVEVLFGTAIDRTPSSERTFSDGGVGYPGPKLDGSGRAKDLPAFCEKF
jgi:hypothetical protein